MELGNLFATPAGNWFKLDFFILGSDVWTLKKLVYKLEQLSNMLACSVCYLFDLTLQQYFHSFIEYIKVRLSFNLI